MCSELVLFEFKPQLGTTVSTHETWWKTEKCRYGEWL